MRYVSIPQHHTKAILGEDEPLLVGMTVHEAEREPVRTGLLDSSGTPLYRVEDRQPIGFRVRDR